MITSDNDEKWNAFENTGLIKDYLAYRGIGAKCFSDVKGEIADADNNGGNSDLQKRSGG